MTNSRKQEEDRQSVGNYDVYDLVTLSDTLTCKPIILLCNVFILSKYIEPIPRTNIGSRATIKKIV